MKLTGIECLVPSSRIFNEDIVELVKYHSASTYQGNLKELETIIKKFLSKTGIESRFWRNKEKPIDMIMQCVDSALKMSGLQKKDIDLVIYSSIDRGFIEPANAAFMCKALGLKDVRNFDIVDACMGWASAVQVADSFLNSSKTISSVLIINSEFPNDKLGTILPNNYTIKEKNELKWKAPSFTLGEGASACIFQKNTNTRCKFEFIEMSGNANFCTIPIMNFEKYLDDMDDIIYHGDMQFYADGAALLERGLYPAIEVLHKLLQQIDYVPEMVFPHSVSYKIIEEASRKANISLIMNSTFTRLGNLATVSIPSAIKNALLNNRLKKNEKSIVWIASAGMKFSAFEIQF